jgi:hypothetical protein
VRRFYEEILNGRNLDAIQELVAPMGWIQGEFVDIPATGEHTTVNGVDWFRIEGGRQAEHWGGPDMLSFLVQLDLLPDPAHRDQARPPSGGPKPVTAAPPGPGRQRSGGTATAGKGCVLDRCAPAHTR